MTLHLAEIAAAVAPGAHAVLLLDQNGWHGSGAHRTAKRYAVAAALGMELNAFENVWQFMRDNWLSSRIFRSYEDILDHCCFAWNCLVDQP